MHPALSRTVDLALEATVVPSFSRIGPAVRRRVDDWSPLPRLDGQRVLVTGVTSGIGRAAAARLLALGAHVVAVGRDETRTHQAVAELTVAAGEPAATVVIADLGELDDVRRVADEAVIGGPLHALVHNAGALLPEHRRTSDGIEVTVAVHLVGPHLLTRLLTPEVARVVWVTSGGMYTQGLDVEHLELPAEGYRGSVAYARAKRAQVELLPLWADRLAPSGVAHAMHPGWVATPGVSTGLPTFERVLGPLLRAPEDGADTLVWLVADEEPARSSGRLWLDRRPRSTVRLPGTGTTPGERRRLWDWVEHRAGLA